MRELDRESECLNHESGMVRELDREIAGSRECLDRERAELDREREPGSGERDRERARIVREMDRERA